MENNAIDGYAEGEEPLHFYHQKGEFRKYYDNDKMPLRDLAEGKNLPKRGLFRVLVGTKSNRAIFMGMIICMALVFVLGFLRGGANEGTVGGMYCEMTAFSFQEQLLVSVELRPSYMTKKHHRGDFGDKSCTASFQVTNSDGQVSESVSQDFLYESPEGESRFIRASFSDYDAAKVTCSLSVDGQTIRLSSSVIRK
ncbi:MAG: hypothetical protein II837_01135 [Treponema sp.]|nr:hypothetical protein [Treponema sp.]MBQ6568518.1 hypothetical protein [Treponema sp.]MBQ7167516.1 hypothetical protein [Treponema sp.]